MEPVTGITHFGGGRLNVEILNLLSGCWVLIYKIPNTPV